MTDQNGLIAEGDEPDRPYDFVEPARPAKAGTLRPATAPRPAETPSTTATPPAESIAASSISPRHADHGASESKQPDPPPELLDSWDGSRDRNLILPIALIVISIICSLVTVSAFSARYRGMGMATEYVLLGVAFRVPVIVILGLPMAHWLNLGTLRPAIMKLCVLAIVPTAAIGLCLAAASAIGLPEDGGLADPITAQLSGATAAAVVTLGADVLLFHFLLEFDNDLENWQLLAFIWLLQFFVGGVGIHMILDPPAPVAQYVPDKGAHGFMIGN
jgi:hypothetical protein